ncbi:MAG: GTPase HflX [Chloroflexota bacterium]
MTTREPPEQALLVGVSRPGSGQKLAAEASLEELAQLAHSAGAAVSGKVIQQLHAPSRTHYLGIGKLTELVALKENLQYNVVILDDQLTPLQQHNLEDSLGVKVIDRAALILDIFARRARTHEGRLQVELAQHQYLLPRLAGKWRHLERLGGGIGTRGPGETQLETDRRLIRQKITRLQRKIEEIRKHRSLYRQRRQKSGLPVVALVGYTNAGKSTLMNALCRSDIPAEDKLFATLDPTTRRLALPEGKAALMTDTVGFIRKLPPEIVSAFRATLEELNEAALLVHVVDFSSTDAPEQCQAVEEVLQELDLADRPRITAMNKIDRLLEPGQDRDEATALQQLEPPEIREDMVMVSATRGWGLERLRQIIDKMLPAAAP